MLAFWASSAELCQILSWHACNSIHRSLPLAYLAALWSSCIIVHLMHRDLRNEWHIKGCDWKFTHTKFWISGVEPWPSPDFAAIRWLGCQRVHHRHVEVHGLHLSWSPVLCIYWSFSNLCNHSSGTQSSYEVCHSCGWAVASNTPSYMKIYIFYMFTQIKLLMKNL